MSNPAATAGVINDRITLARNYISDYWPDHVSAIGLRRALNDPPSSYDEEIYGSDDFDDYTLIADIPLRNSLRLPDEMFEAMATAYENIRRKVDAQYDDGIAPGANERYQDQWDAELYPHRFRLDYQGLFFGLASCRGGDEVAMIFGHPRHGLDKANLEGQPDLMNEDEYRERTSPYVAAFGREVYPGDLEAGLVLKSVRHYLEPGAAEK